MLTSAISKVPHRLIRSQIRLVGNISASFSGASSSTSLSNSPSATQKMKSIHQSNVFFAFHGQHRFFQTHPLQARETIKVPGMGDSITEGTIVEWCVPPGALVNEGDVVALIETDKVTVDIKADKTGVLVEQLGEVEGVVEVGEGLYVLDSDTSLASTSTADSGGANTDSSAPATETVEEIAAAASEPAKKSSKRTPSIHFLGKEGWKERLTATDASSSSSQTSATTTVTNAKPHSPSTITQIPYSAMYGRPPITDEEMEALVLGGAEEAPEVKKVISKDGLSGVVFVGGRIVTAGPRGVWLAEEQL